MSDGTGALVSEIRDAAREPWRWPHVVQELAGQFDATVAIYAVMAPRTGTPDLRRVACAGMPEHTVAEWGARNPWLRGALAQRVGTVVPIDRLVAPEDIPEDFREHIIDRFAMQYGLGVTVVNSGGTYAAYSVYRPRPFHGEELRTFGRLFGPFEQATHFEQHLGGSMDWIYRAAGATVLVAGDGRLCFANAAAERLLQTSAILQLDGRTLHATSSADQHTLEAVLRAVSHREVWRASAVLGETGVLGVTAIAIHGELRPEGAPDATVALFLSDPDVRARDAVQFLRHSYGLTEAESHVLEAILHGHGLGDVSHALGIATTTAKTHLQHVFQKTRTRRQAELVRLALGATP